MSIHPVLGPSNGVESKEEKPPLPVVSEKARAVAQPLSGFLANLSRRAAAICHPLEVDGEVTDEQLKLIGEFALASQEKTRTLWDFIMRSKDPKTYTAKIGLVASRAITALILVRFSFSGKDLSGVNIPNANLARGIFHKTNFIGANLQGVQLQQAYLGNTWLQKANLRGANFGQFTLKASKITCKEARSLTVQGPLVAIGEDLDLSSGKSPEIHIWSLSEARAWNVCNWKQDTGVVSLAMTKDCNRLVVVGGDGHVTVWNPNNGALMHKLRLEGIDHCVVSKSPDKPMIACTHRSGDIFLFDAITGQPIDSFLREDATGKAHFMPDGIGLLIPTKKGIKLFDTRLKTTIKILRAPPLWDQQYGHVILSTDGKWIATAGLMGVVIWSIEREEPVNLLGNSFAQEHTRAPQRHHPLAGGVESIAFSNDGKLLAISAGKEIQIWDTTNWYQLDRWGGESLVNNATALQFTSDDQYVVAIFNHEDPKVWKFSRTLSYDMETHLDDVQTLCVTADKRTVFTLSSNTLRIWKVKDGACMYKEDAIEQFAVCKEGRYLLTLQKNCAVLLEIATGVAIKRFERPSGICGVYFLSTGKAMVIGKETVEIYDIPTRMLTSILQGKMASLIVHALSDNRQWLAWGTKEGDLLACNSFDIGNVHILRKAHPSTITSIKFSRDTIISKSDSGVHIWAPSRGLKRFVNDCADALVLPADGGDRFILKRMGILEVYAEKGQDKKLILEHKLRVDCKNPFESSESPDAKIIHMLDDYGREKQWSQGSEMMYMPDSKHSPTISTMTLHPSLPILAVGGNNGMIQLWDPESGHLRTILWGHVATITCLTFSDDGEDLFSGSKDRSLQRWDLREGIEKAQLAWRSPPYSLVLRGVNTFDAVLDEREKNLLVDEGAKTDQGVAFELFLRNKVGYVQRPYVFPEAENRSFSEIEVSSHNLDEAIIRIHHRILKKEDDREFVQQIVLCMKDLYLLTPASFHFILGAIEAVAGSLQAHIPVDPASLSRLQKIFEVTVPVTPIFVRDFLDATLRVVSERLIKIIKMRSG